MELTDAYEQAIIYRHRQLKRHGHGKLEISYHHGQPQPIRYTETMHPLETKSFVEHMQLTGTLQS